MTRILFITGMPSGGTTCAAQTLFRNGWYRGRVLSAYERPDARDIFHNRSMFKMPGQGKPNGHVVEPEEYADRLRREADRVGARRVMVKLPWIPLWEPDRLVAMGCDVLLVARDVDENAESLARRFSHVAPQAGRLALWGQTQIKALHDELGWPVWWFGHDGEHRQLEAAVGDRLPVEVFDPMRIRSGKVAA